MSKILQINFKYNISGAEFRLAAAAMADGIAAVAGLRWKVWVINEANSEGGGIHLFEDEASVQAYRDGPIFREIASSPALSEFSAKQFDVMEDLTAVTRGPIRETAQA
jgi:hypothetical protein